MTWMNTPRQLALGSAILVGVAACAVTQRIETAERVADAGIGYADSLPPVLDESLALSVTADSLVLAKVRGDIPETTRAERLQQSRELLTKRLEILRYLKQHALLLRSYFIAMKSITETNAASGISDATKGLVAKMATISPKIAESSIGGATIGDLVGPLGETGRGGLSERGPSPRARRAGRSRRA